MYICFLCLIKIFLPTKTCFVSYVMICKFVNITWRYNLYQLPGNDDD